MANQEHLDILQRDVEAWNHWRHEHEDIQPNLRGANLIDANLSYTDLSFADLREAELFEANLSNADLFGTNLREARLLGADLSFVDLREADLTGTRLNRADLSRAILGRTTFGDVDLREVKGLETLWHLGPSTIGIDTIYRSQGHIPEIFLRKAGVPETFITNMRALIESMSPIGYYTCFISYSSKDQVFAEQLHADLLRQDVQCWFAPHDMKIGDKIRHRIDESIHLYDKLLLVLSEHSVKSQWVEKEVETAFEKERQYNKEVLFPIRLDETVMQTKEAWAADIRRTRHIGDFTKWKQHDDYQQAFERLLRDLKAEGNE